MAAHIVRLEDSHPFDKAVYAMILNRNSYQSVARNVLASSER